MAMPSKQDTQGIRSTSLELLGRTNSNYTNAPAQDVSECLKPVYTNFMIDENINTCYQ